MRRMLGAAVTDLRSFEEMQLPLPRPVEEKLAGASAAQGPVFLSSECLFFPRARTLALQRLDGGASARD